MPFNFLSGARERHVTHEPAQLPGGADAVEALRSCLEGKLHLPGEAGYAEARACGTWQLDPVSWGYPSAIVSVACAEDVAAAVKYATAHQVRLCVAGGRHTHMCVVNDRLMVDLTSHLNAVTIDAEHHTAAVGGGAKQEALDFACRPYGLAVTTGHVPSVGVGGQMTHTGGRGYLERVYGTGVDNLLSVQVVLASGEVVTASEQENRDLFWALKGGGLNFGIITEFIFKLHRLPNNGDFHSACRMHIPLGMLGWPDRNALLMAYAQRVNTAPREFSADLYIPGGSRFTPVAEEAVWVGDPVAGREYFEQHVHTLGRPVKETMGIHNYHTKVQRTLLGEKGDRVAPMAMYERSELLRELTPEVCQVLSEFLTGPFPRGVHPAAHVTMLGGKAHEVPFEDAACIDRTSTVWAVLIGEWRPPGDLTARAHAKERVCDAARKIKELNHWQVETEEPTGEIAFANKFWGPNFKRLVELKQRFDPTTVFSDTTTNTPLVTGEVPGSTASGDSQRKSEFATAALAASAAMAY